MKTLETERLLLRQFRESDLDAYAAVCADEEVMRYLGGRALSREEAWRHMAMIVGHWHWRGYGLWAVEEKATGEFMGRIGCWKPEGWPEVEVGWTLRRESWGKGYAAEGARASLDFAFEELGRERVVSLIHPENRRSIRLAEKLGERRDGEWEVFGIGVSVYAITRGEWERKRA